jgi:hypothetical protein
MTKKPHVPETRVPKLNRELRRHPEKLDPKKIDPEKIDAVQQARVREEQEEILKRGTDDDVSVRAKSTGHGKKTADKWNQ